MHGGRNQLMASRQNDLCQASEASQISPPQPTGPGQKKEMKWPAFSNPPLQVRYAIPKKSEQSASPGNGYSVNPTNNE